jgi:hypothetical protein
MPIFWFLWAVRKNRKNRGPEGSPEGSGLFGSPDSPLSIYLTPTSYPTGAPSPPSSTFLALFSIYPPDFGALLTFILFNSA